MMTQPPEQPLTLSNELQAFATDAAGRPALPDSEINRAARHATAAARFLAAMLAVESLVAVRARLAAPDLDACLAALPPAFDRLNWLTRLDAATAPTGALPAVADFGRAGVDVARDVLRDATVLRYVLAEAGGRIDGARNAKRTRRIAARHWWCTEDDHGMLVLHDAAANAIIDAAAAVAFPAPAATR